MKYKIKKDEVNNHWYVVTKNVALNYVISTNFNTKKDAENYVKNEINMGKELMLNVISVEDYLKIEA